VRNVLILKEAIKQEIEERGTIVFPEVIDILFDEAKRRGYNLLADELKEAQTDIEFLAENLEENEKVRGKNDRNT